LHLIPSPAAPGVDATKAVNVHSIAIQVPKTQLTSDGSNPTSVTDPKASIGFWASASRQKTSIRDRSNGGPHNVGPWVQVSRLGQPLINEVIIPLGLKDEWNLEYPVEDSQFLAYYQNPELAKLLPVLYPGVFPHLAAIASSPTNPRADLVAILLTGIPGGLIPGFQNFTGSTPADQLRLNLAIPPASQPSIFGILGGDLAGYPNGRRVFDDVVTIEVRAIAGVTYPLVNHTFTPDAAASVVTDGLTPSSLLNPYLSSFPYLGTPYDGFDNPSS
jgi:hypothetical protein